MTCWQTVSFDIIFLEKTVWLEELRIEDFYGLTCYYEY